MISPFVFNFQNGSGVTFSNLFKTWPAECLANLHSSPQEPDHSICKNFYRFTNEDIHRPWPFRSSNGASSLGAGASESIGDLNWSFWRKYIVGNSGLPQKFEPSRDLLDWLDSFRPELIYTILGAIPHMEAIAFIQKRYGCKLVVHFMDDWYHQAYTTGIFRFQRRKMLRLFHQIIDQASAHLAIGDEMARVFSERYKKPMRAFQNAISVQNFRSEILAAQGDLNKSKHAQSLLYFGSVYDFAQVETLRLIATAVEKLKGKTVLSHKLRIVTSEECMNLCRSNFSEFSMVELGPILKDNGQFARELAQAAVLVLPANFNTYSEEFLRYSMPTKLPGYMASGVPIFVCAPKSIAQVKYAQANGWGYCVTVPQVEPISAAIQELLFNIPLRKELTEKALKIVEKNHEIEVVRSEFQGILTNVCVNR